MTLNSSVPTSSVYQYFYWLDRDWLHHSHGIQIGPDLHCGAHWRAWESNARTQTLEIDWKQCWMNYVETYGDICFGVIAGVPGEVLR